MRKLTRAQIIALLAAVDTFTPTCPRTLEAPLAAAREKLKDALAGREIHDTSARRRISSERPRLTLGE